MNATAQNPPASSAMPPPLDPGVVQVWRLTTTPELVTASAPLLGAEERERMFRIRAGHARDEFVVARAALRALLAGAIAQNPRTLAFTVGPSGKPVLASVEGRLHFNVSHSHGCILIALCRSTEIGVDIERINPSIEALDIAKGSFAAQERQAIEAAEGNSRTETFYRIWTRKEAVVKAHGQGLSIPLDSFSVSAEAIHQTVTLRSFGDTYFVSDLATSDKNFVAALAVVAMDLPVQIVAPTRSALIEMLHQVAS